MSQMHCAPDSSTSTKGKKTRAFSELSELTEIVKKLALNQEGKNTLIVADSGQNNLP